MNALRGRCGGWTGLLWLWLRLRRLIAGHHCVLLLRCCLQCSCQPSAPPVQVISASMLGDHCRPNVSVHCDMFLFLQAQIGANLDLCKGQILRRTCGSLAAGLLQRSLRSLFPDDGCAGVHNQQESIHVSGGRQGHLLAAKPCLAVVSHPSVYDIQGYIDHAWESQIYEFKGNGRMPWD